MRVACRREGRDKTGGKVAAKKADKKTERAKQPGKKPKAGQTHAPSKGEKPAVK
jgi:hypothetical protein